MPCVEYEVNVWSYAGLKMEDLCNSGQMHLLLILAMPRTQHVCPQRP
jgi:hypothetical protein